MTGYRFIHKHTGALYDWSDIMRQYDEETDSKEAVWIDEEGTAYTSKELADKYHAQTGPAHQPENFGL